MGKTPIPPRRPVDDRVAQLERAVSALVDLANPEAFRKALAAASARNALAELAKAVAAGHLDTAGRVSDRSVAVRFKEVRGDEVVTPAVVAQLSGMDAGTRALFEGKAVGEQVSERDGVVGILDAVWDSAAPARIHRPRGARHGCR